MKFEIKSRWSGNILFSLETDSMRLCLEAAVKQGAYLEGANLKGANLEGAYLKGADLNGANLEGANLNGADLEDADLEGANLNGADLEGADLEGANLNGADLEGAYLNVANLKGADLEGAYLKGADLNGAYLKDADLEGANLQLIRDDVWAVLSSAPAEVEGLKKALLEGRVDGSTYSGDCACLVGTIANVRGCSYTKLPVLKPDSNRPAERFFLAIKEGDTPENSQAAKIALEWIDQWLENVKAAFGTPAVEAKERG